MNDHEQSQLKLLHLQADLHDRLNDLDDVYTAIRYGLRATREMFEVKEAAIAIMRLGRVNAELYFTMPQKGDWDVENLTQYIKGARPSIPKSTLMAPIQRRDRNWGVLALRDRDRSFDNIDRRVLFSITQTLTDIIRSIDERRVWSVRHKIEQKIADRQDPKDLIYDLLHGLRSLTRYDHSAALMIAKDGSNSLELVAEQIAWTKAKSKMIGLRLELDDETHTQLQDGRARFYERTEQGWQGPENAPLLPELLDYNASSNERIPSEVAAVYVPITTPVDALGILKISARRPDVLTDYQAKLVEEFIPLASLAVQFLVRTEYMHDRVVQSERKHALANLTRGITHDMNNALGAVLPLVQQIKEDARENRIDTKILCEDLASIEKSLQTCRRIFSSMLTIARGAKRDVGHGNMRRAIDGALTVLEDSLKRQSIEVILDLPNELPAIRGSQGDLTQLFLNLFTNARDAMSAGGSLSITAKIEPDAVRVEICDTGSGMTAAVLDRILEPFYTTKDDGNGLGLSISRSVIWDIGGDMNIKSTEGEGTSVMLTLPILSASEEADV